MSASVLTACGTGTVRVSPPPPPPPPTIDPSLRQPCPPALSRLQRGDAAEVLAAHDRDAEQYHSCRDRLAALAAAVTSFEEAVWSAYCRAVAAAGLHDRDCEPRK